MTAKVVNMEKSNELIQTVKEASRLYKEKAELLTNLTEVEGFIDGILPKVCRHPEKSLTLMLRDTNLYAEGLFDVLVDAVKEKQYWQAHGLDWSYTPPRRRKKGR